MGKRFSYRSALDFLLDLERSGIKLGLDRTVNLLDAIGNPQRSFKSVHIAGTNGKGSVAAYLNSILYHSGYKTGLFTSPHLVEYSERVRVDGESVSRAELASLVTDIEKPVVQFGASFFEATTAVAFEHFKRKGVEIAAVEVGMGGRLDSTNVLLPELTAITSVDFDHERYLGRTLAKIAGEKAGILKPGVPVVTGELRAGASRAVAGTAESLGCQVYQIGHHANFAIRQMGIGGCEFEYRGLQGRRVFRTAMPGRHQAANASLAVLCAEVLRDRGMEIGDGAVDSGLRAVLWPGRLQILRRRPLVICDGAHNASGSKMLAGSLKEMGIFPAVTVFAVLRDKRYQVMLRHLAAVTRRFVLTKPNNPRALPVRRLREAAVKTGVPSTSIARVGRAVEYAMEGLGRADALLICGSLFAIGEAMQYLGYRPHRVKLC